MEPITNIWRVACKPQGEKKPRAALDGRELATYRAKSYPIVSKFLPRDADFCYPLAIIPAALMHPYNGKVVDRNCMRPAREGY